jgi:myo-inositol 2-dehydrogenase / D-chiro-inositol 1-dehydrogenase
VVAPYSHARAALGGSLPTFEGLDAMLGECELDGALVAAPTDLHVDVVRRLTAAGLPVLCEKPCGLTVEDTAECARAAEEAGRLLQVAYWRRFVPQLQLLRARLAAGELGEVLAVNCYQWDESPPPAEFRKRSGGIFVEMGVHEFDQIRWLTGEEIETVRVAASRHGETAGEPDCAQLVAELSRGGTALVSLGRRHPAGDVCRVEVFGTEGTAASSFLEPPHGDGALLEALRRQAEHFARSARGREHPDAGEGATVADAAAALVVAATATDQLSHPAPAPVPLPVQVAAEGRR